MKVLILAAGYGTRLEQAIRADPSDSYRHLVGIPKPLLPVGKMPLVSHWLHITKDISEIDQVYVVTNDLNHEKFESWAADWPLVKLMSDHSTSNETRTGAVGCIELAVRNFNITDDLLIIAGDTLFYDDFSLAEFVSTFHRFQKHDTESSLIVYVSCSDEEVSKRGILETDDEDRVTGFVEKPQPSQTSSRKSCPCFYLLSRHSLPLLSEFLLIKKDEPLKVRDAPGNFLSYLVKRKAVYCTPISGRHDVGDLNSYISCHQQFLSK